MSTLTEVRGSFAKTHCNRDTTLFPVMMSKSIQRKVSLSRTAKLKQLDAISFGANIRTARSRHTSKTVDFFHRIGGVKDTDDASNYSEASDDESRMEPSVPFSPLSMLFEGILADCMSDFSLNAACHDDSPYPYSPVSDSHVRTPAVRTVTAALDIQEYSQLQSEASTPSTASSSLGTPKNSPHGEPTSMLDQAIAEMIAENALSDARSRSSQQGLLVPEGSLLFASCFPTPSPSSTATATSAGFSRPPRRHPFSATRTSKQSAAEDVDSYRLTMPGGGPLWEPNEFDNSFKPFWESPPGSVSSQQTVIANERTSTQVIKVNDAPPPRPPRPKHCSVTLKNLGPITTTVPGEFGSPSLKGLRKTPAEYLKTKRRSPPDEYHKTHRRSSSIYTLENFKAEDLTKFKLAPAPSRVRPLVLEERQKSNRSSTVSTSSFVSAKSEVSAKPKRASAAAAKMPDYPQEKRQEFVKLRHPVVSPPKQPLQERVQLRDPMDSPKLDQLRFRTRRQLHPPSASRAPRPQQLDLPQAMDSPPAIQKQPSLLRKLSVTLGLSSKPKVSLSGPTDYSMEPHSSSGLSSFNMTVTPFPTTTRRPSVSSTTRSPPVINLVRTTSRNRSYSNAPRISPSPGLHTSPCPPPPILVRQTSRARSNSNTSNTSHAPRQNTNVASSPPSTTRNRAYSTTSNLSHSRTSSQTQTLPRKSSLKRRPSLSSNALGLDRKQSSRRTIVDSAKECVTASSGRKVTFGQVQEQVYDRPQSDVPMHPHDPATCNDEVMQNEIKGEAEEVEGLEETQKPIGGEEEEDEEQQQQQQQQQKEKSSYMASLRGMLWGRK